MNRLIYFIFRTSARYKHYIDRRATTEGKIFLFMALVSFFFGLNPERNMFFQLFPILFILLLLGFFFSLRLKINLDCERTLPATCVAGSKLTYPVKLSNNTANRAAGILFREWQQTYLPSYGDAKKDFTALAGKQKSFLSKAGITFLSSQFFPKTHIESDAAELPNLAPHTSSEHRVSLSPQKRGNHHFDGFILFRTDPFGLFLSSTIIKEPANLLVLPKLYPAAKLAFDGSRKYNQGGLTASKDHGDSEEFISLREYMHGDPIKHIDWKSSAKTGNIIIKQYKSEYFSRYGMVLDTFCSPNDENLFEAAVSAAASLFMAQDLGESVLDLLFVGDRCYQETASRGSGDQVHFLKILASVQPCYENRFSDLHALVEGNLDQLSGLVIIFFKLDHNRKKLIQVINSRKIPNTTIVLCVNRDAAQKKLKLLDWQEPVFLVEESKLAEQLAAL